jgi:hypothetical protein
MANYLKGNSGCILEILSKKNFLFVKKISPEISYNERLIKQAQKQEDFSLLSFETPKIIQKAKDVKGRFFFTMEYLNGENLSHFIKRATSSEIKIIYSKLIEIIPLKDSICSISNSDKIKMKIDELKNKQIIKKYRLTKILNLIMNFDWSQVPLSNCHGDFTLENIIVSKNKFYLIDFLDSFIDSWLIDISKLYQDLEFYWSYRNEKISNSTIIKLKSIKAHIYDYILTLPNGHYFIKAINKLFILNLIRTLPYNKSNELNLKIIKFIKQNKRRYL